MSDRIDEHREQISNRLGEPEKLRFPDGWTVSSSWRRALGSIMRSPGCSQA